jgi:hypothetical protein
MAVFMTGFCASSVRFGNGPGRPGRSRWKVVGEVAMRRIRNSGRRGGEARSDAAFQPDFEGRLDTGVRAWG